MHLDAVVTSTIHHHANEWQVAGVGVAVAREERRKLREWSGKEIMGSKHSETRSTGVRKAGALETECNRRTRVPDGRKPAFRSPRRDNHPRPMATLGQCRAPTRKRGNGTCDTQIHLEAR